MSDRVFVGRNTESLRKSPELDAVACVRLNVDDETYCQYPYGTVDENEWASKPAGVYEFVYDGANWTKDGVVIDIQNYGFKIEGPPIQGDKFVINVWTEVT